MISAQGTCSGDEAVRLSPELRRCIRGPYRLALVAAAGLGCHHQLRYLFVVVVLAGSSAPAGRV